jgi:hypothetical protein
MRGDCCAHHNFTLAIGSGVPFFPEIAGSRGLSGHHFLAVKKPAVAARKKRAPVLPSVRLNAITCG